MWKCIHLHLYSVVFVLNDTNTLRHFDCIFMFYSDILIAFNIARLYLNGL